MTGLVPALAVRLRAPRAEDRRPEVPGWDVGELVARGATTEVYRATPWGGGTPAALLLREETSEARRRARALTSLHHDHLLAVLGVGTAQDGRLAVVTPLYDGTLAEALARGGDTLDPGEIAGLLDALGSALGRLHEAGLVHGDVRPENVLVAPDGRLVLADLLEHPAHLPGPPDACADVGALIELVRSLCGGLTPSALRDVERTLENRDGAAGARDLAAGAALIAAPEPLAAHRRPEPVRRTGPVLPTRTPHAPGRRRWRARRAIGTGIAVLALGAGAAAWAPREHPGPEVAARAEVGTDVAVPPDVAVAVSGLAARRDAVLEAGDPAGLSDVDAPESPALRTDRELLGELADRDVVARGLRSTVAVDAVVAGDPEDERFTVRATLAQSASTREGRGGATTVPAPPDRCVEISLRRTGDGLRVEETRACPTG